MRFHCFSRTILSLCLVFTLVSSEANDGHRGGRYYSNHHHHGGHRRQRETHVYGNGIHVHHESEDGSAVATSSSSSSFSTTSEDESPGVAGTYEVHIPGRTVYETTGSVNSVNSLSASESIGSLSLGSVQPPTPILRPIGDLPVPPRRFGFEVLPIRVDAAEAVPNCGCLQRCVGEVGLYTLQVVQYSDLVCGTEFKTCCFDGPYPGSQDMFADIAACVPKELCMRPYGVLPTDVRDFGVIGPCPGYGAVRCIAVDSVGLLEFRAALSAIEASNSAGYRREFHVSPMHLVLPLLKNGAKTTSISAESSASVKLDVDSLLARPQVRPIYVSSGGKPGKTTIVQTETTDEGTSVQVTRPSVSVDQPPRIIIVKIPPKPVVPAAQPLPPTPVVQPPAPAPVVQPPRPALGYYRSPYVGGLYPGFGYGGGLGFHKHFHLSKGFGFGSYF